MNYHSHQNTDQSVYTCPMHPNIKQDKPSHCPECGMALVRKSEVGSQKSNHGDQNRHDGHSTQNFLRKFWVSLILTIPIIISHFSPDAIPYSPSISLVLGTIVFFYGGWIFINGAKRELVGKSPGMMTLIALAVITAFTYSVYGALTGGETLFWELASLITIMLLGHYLEMRAVQGAQGALKELSKLLPDEAELVKFQIRNSKSQTISKSQIPNSKLETETVPLEQLQINNLVLVRPGGRIPADGVVVEGESDIDEAIVTGESRPVNKKAGSEVIAGSINGDGSLIVKVAKIGEQTFLAGVMRLVQEAQSSKSKIQILADRAALYLTIIAIVSGLLTLFVWLARDSLGFAVERMVAVLVIACPHALGLAIPLVASISTTLAARRGFLVRDRLALEQARNIDVVLFDKTGTLTTGEFGVASIASFPLAGEGWGERQILRLAASVDAHSEHFIARALVREAKKRNIELLPVKDFQRIPGKGVKGVVEGKEVLVGGEAILSVMPDLPARRTGGIRHPESKNPGFPARLGGGPIESGSTQIFVILDNKLMGSIFLADQIREESREAVTKLRSMNVKVAMITGDSEEVAKWVANQLEIDRYYARVLPDEKVKIVEGLKKGKFGNWKLEIGNSSRRLAVAFVGDGVNDAPALAQADLGIAIGAGTNVAIESAGIVLVKNDPRDIPEIISLSKRTYRKMLQNLFWATGYNVIALPLAAGILASKGILLEPALGAVFMSLSTVIVSVNALLLKKIKI